MNQPRRLDEQEMAEKHRLAERGGSYANPLPKKPGKHAATPDEDLTPQQRYERHKRPSYFIRNREKCNRWRAEYEKRRRKEDPEYNERRKAQARALQQRRRLAKRELLYQARNKPCVDCGTQLPPEIMDLDHVRGEKLFNLGGVKGNAYHSIESIRMEIDKCDVRCPNCHRLRHYHDRQQKGVLCSSTER